MSEVVPLADGGGRLALRREGHRVGRRGARRAADPARHRAVGRVRRRGRRGTGRARSSSSSTAARPLRGPLAVRSSAADEDGADASFAGQHLTLLNVPSVDDAAPRPSARSGGRRTPTPRSPTASASASSQRPSVGVVVQSLLDPDVGRRDVHAEPDQRRRRADDRGELGTRRGRRRRPRDPRHLPHRPRRRGARTHARAQEDRDPRRGRRRHLRGDRRARAHRGSCASTTTQLARAAARSRRAATRCTDRRATSSGRSPTGSSTCCSAAR